MKTFKIQYILAWLTLFFVAMPSASAADRFYVESVNIEPGETKQLSFILENSQEFFGFQTDIELPSGLRFVTSEGKAEVSLSSRANGGFYSIVSNLLSENKLRLGAFSASHTALSGHDGVLLYATVYAGEDFADGTVSLNNIRFIDSDDRDVRLPDSSTEIFLYVNAESITLDKTAVELKAGESISLTASVFPETATDKTLTWSSNNSTVATVDAEGKVTAIAIGEATITATCGSVSATCKVSVVTTPAESITLSQTTAQLKAGESVTLTATVLPETATDKTVTWSSNNTAIATVDANGKVTAIAVGETTITATCGSVSATCIVNVVTTPAESITISQTTAQLKAGESVTLTATVLPETTTNKTVTWNSSDENVATVDAEGKVTAIAVGEATITATCGGVSASCKVRVMPILAESITLSHESWNGEEGESFTLVATVLPENTTDKTVSWSSSDPEIATVDAEGHVSVLKAGYCTITASTQDGSNLSAECIITSASGIDDLFTDSEARFDVYNLQGVLLKKGCGRDYLKQLSTGAYILRQGNVSKKVIIR